METLYAYLAGAIDIDGRIVIERVQEYLVVAVMGDRSPTIRRL